MKENILIGKTVKKVFIADDMMAMKFEIEGQPDVIVRTDGDCCSHSWIEHIEFSQIFPSMVTGVEDVSMQEIDENRELVSYGCKIHTDNGVMFIEYRNESNGYYGGNLCWPGDNFYGGVYDQNKSSEVWVELLEDF